MTDEQLLAEIEDLLRTMPPKPTLRHPTEENHAWLGRAAAIIENWSRPNIVLFRTYVSIFHTGLAGAVSEGYRQMMTMLHQARHDLRMRTVGPINVALQRGMVFDYFDEVRKLVETAKQDLLFVDPYLDAEFVSRYLPHVSAEVTIRLLTREKIQTLLPAVDALVQQSRAKVEVRSAPGFHDRYVIVDRNSCYQSGASFKDGAKSAPTTLTQITDAFAAVLQTYEELWNRAKLER